MKYNLNNFNENIRHIVKRKALSQQDFCFKTGLNIHTALTMLYGKKANPTMKTAIKICEGLGITMEELLK